MPAINTSPNRCSKRSFFSHYVLRATLSVVWRHNDITGKIPYKAMTNENKIIYLDRETMQGNVKKKTYEP